MIIGNQIRLRSIEEADLPQLYKWANDPEVWRNLGGWHFPYTFQSTKTWYSSLNASSPNQYFAIVNEKNILLGTATLDQIDWKNRHAHHGMVLGDIESRGLGYGSDTIQTIMRYAFEDLGMIRLDASIIEFNTNSLKAYVGRCGWKKEGIQRKWFFRESRYWDRILIGITIDDYAEWKEKGMRNTAVQDHQSRRISQRNPPVGEAKSAQDLKQL